MKISLKQILIFITSIHLISCKPSKQELEILKNKYFKKITPRNLEFLQNREKLQNTITYKANSIKAIIDELEIPDEYNFFDDTGVQKIVKNQKYCGSCWSHASTTALAYRFSKKLGTDINLSPQNGLSCYIPDCVDGDYVLDSFLHLVKNGTVTEGCFPFVSGDGETMPECPTTCEDGSEYIKYYAQDVFSSLVYYDDENNFYMHKAVSKLLTLTIWAFCYI